MTLKMEGGINWNKNQKEIKRKGQSTLAQRSPEASRSSYHDHASVTTRWWQVHHMTSSSIHRTVQPNAGRGPHLQTNHLGVPVCFCVTWQSLPYHAASASPALVTQLSTHIPCPRLSPLARSASVGPPSPLP